MPTTTQFDYQKYSYEILNSSSIGLIILDEKQRIVWCNPQCEIWFKHNVTELTGQPWLSLPLEAYDESGSLYLLTAKHNKDTITLQHWQSSLASDAQLQVHYFKAEPHSLKAHLQGANQFKRPNWGQFLDYEVSRSRRYDNPLALLKLHLLIFDNQQYTHQDIQKETSYILKDELRWADMVGLSDTLDFLIVLPETPATALPSLIEKIKASTDKQLQKNFPGLDFTVAIGHAIWQRGDNSSLLIEKARDSLVKQLQTLINQ